MRTPKLRFDSLEALRQFVAETLSTQDKLEVGGFPLTERLLVRRGRPCGMYFCLHGPRAVRLVAIWETDSHAILFYTARGERFHKIELGGSPELPAIAA